MTSRISTLLGAIAAGGVLAALVTHTEAPKETPATFCGNYSVVQSSGSIVAGTADTGNHCDDCTTSIQLPFAYNFYGKLFTSANVSSNGTLQFSSNLGSNATFCIPDNGHTIDSIYVFPEDLTTNTTGDGVFTSVSGAAPSRVFNIEWRTHPFGGKTGTNFEIRLYEATPRFDLVYGGSADKGANAGGIGAQQGDGIPPNTWITVGCRTGALGSGVVFVFQAPLCDQPTPTPTPQGPSATLTPTPTRTFTPVFTSTPTFTPVFTPTWTFTPIFTETPTRTPTRTQTPVPTATFTPVVPQASATPTPTPLPGAPSVTNESAGSIGSDGAGGYQATLSADVSPNGASTQVQFELGRTNGYGTDSGWSNAGGGNSTHNQSTVVNGLGCGVYRFRAVAQNSGGTTYGGDVGFTTAPCPRGDQNGDTLVDVKDVFYLVNNLFSGGPAPVYPPGADVNSDGVVNTQDVFFLVNYLFAGGPAPQP
jgi:hypothetical protein